MKHPLPTPQQALYMENAFSMFMHYGVNTYTSKSEHNCVKRGETCIPASKFNPTFLDTDQWARTAVSMGAYAICLTAKHEGGFALWPSNYTNYSVLASPKPIDVVGSFVKSCRKYGLQPCFYESPVENGYAMNLPTPPDVDTFITQELRFYDELLGGKYGHIERIWWDHYPGSCGGLSACPKGSFPQNYQRVINHVRSISPNTLISNGPDSQWVGNTKGVGTYPVWNNCKLNKTKLEKWCQSFSASGTTYMPRMEGFSLQQSGDWFWHEGQIPLNASTIWWHWYRTVGRGTHWLLNVPPNSSGIIPEAYVKELSAFGNALKSTLKNPVAFITDVTTNCMNATDYIMLSFPVEKINMVQLREDVKGSGQIVVSYILDVRVDEQWITLTGDDIHGETIGHRIVDLFKTVHCNAIRFQCTNGMDKTAHIASFSVHLRDPLLI